MQYKSPKLLSKTYKKLLDFYQDRLTQHGPDDPQALSYNSRTTQELRFAQFLKVIPKDTPVSVLDVGCGLGDFSGYLDRQGYAAVAYTGLDVVPEMIAGARKKYPGKTFLQDDILTAVLPAYDYVVSSGALNIIFTTAEEQARHIEQAVMQMWAMARRGLAFNLLNIHSKNDFVQDALFFYSNPAAVLAFCQKLASRARLFDSYLDYDFTIVMEKT